MQTSQSPEPSSRRGFWQRLSFYAAGLGIGFLMMGLIQKGREAQLRQREAAERAAASKPVEQKDWGGFPPPVRPTPQPGSATEPGPGVNTGGSARGK